MKNKLPVFDPATGFDSAPTARNPRRVHTIRINNKPVPISEEELKALESRLNAHADTHGVLYGFFGSLLDGDKFKAA